MSNRLTTLPLLLIALLAYHSANAVNQTWIGVSGVDGKWSNISNWSNGATPGSTSLINSIDIAIFNAAVTNTWGNAAGNPILIDSATQNISGLSFTGAAGNYFIGSSGGNALKLSGGGTIQVLNTLTAFNTIETINAALALQDTTYTFGNNSASGGGAGSGTLIFGGGITGVTGSTQLNLNGLNTNANTISGIIGNGAATSVAITKSGAGTWILSGANTYSGATTISAGVLNIQNASALGTGAAGASVTSGAALQIQGGISTLAKALTLNGSGISTTGALRNISGINNYAGLITLGSAARINSDAGTLTISNTGIITGATFGLTVGGVGNTTIQSIIGTTTGTLTKDGTGTLTLSGANTYTGRTTVSGGALVLAFSALTSNIIASTSALTLGGGTLSLTGTGTQQLSGLTTTGSTGSKILLGSNQTLTLIGANSFGSASALNFNTAAGGANGNTVGSGIVLLSGQTAGNAINSGFTVRDSGGFGLATVNGSSQIVRLTTTTLLPVTGADSFFDYRINNNSNGPATAGSSSLTITASQSAKSITVDTSAANGVVTLSSGAVLSNNIWNFGGTGSNTWQISGNASGAGIQAISSGSGIEINNWNSGVITLNCPILANGSNTVNVKGTGTTVLAGLNTYTGATTIRGGALQVTGTITHTTAAMTVGSGSGENGTLSITAENIMPNTLTLNKMAIITLTDTDYGYFRGDSISGSNIISSVRTAQNLKVGTAISAATGIPSGTTITAVNGPSSTIKLSANATNSVTVLISTLKGNLTNGTSTVTNLSNTQGLAVGMLLISSGIPTGARITAINSGALTLTLSSEATATAEAVPMSIYMGTLTLGSDIVQNVTSLGAFTANMAVSGLGLPPGYLIVEVMSVAVSNTTGTLGSSIGSIGTATVSSGTWTNSGELTVGYGGTGVLNITGGAVSNTTGTLGRNAGSSGTVTVSSGTWTNTGALGLIVGDSGTGVLNITGGAVSNTSGFLGRGAGSSGTATVSSGTWTYGVLIIGAQGTGVLNLTGGALSSTGNVHLGTGRNSSGTATVSAGIWTNGGYLNIGDIGAGVLNITGGNLSSGSGSGSGSGNGSGSGSFYYDSYIGSKTGSSGAATVSGGNWTNGGDLIVANYGAGVLNIAGGGVSSFNGYVGSEPGSSGMATLSSGTWTNSGSLLVGSSGTGVLNVTGGAVSNTTGTLGSSIGSSGTATVSSGTWTNSGSLLVGSSGTGVLNVTDSGIVHVGGVVGTGTLTLGNLAGASGTLNLGTGGVAGTLNASTVTSGSGSAVVNFNHTGSYSFAPVLTGTLVVNKLGAGTTMLTGTNTYSGVTTVSTGALQLGNANAMQNSTVSLAAANGLAFSSGIGSFNLGGLSGAGNQLLADTGAAAVVLNVGGNGSTQTYSGNLSGAGGSLTKGSTGILSLTGANTYTGPTSVTGGVLRVNGSISASSAVGVTGGALGGTGAINGGVTLSLTGGIDLRDAAVGTLTLGSTLTITGAAGANPLFFDLDAASSGTDKIIVGGITTVTNAGAAVVNINQLGGVAAPITPGTYTLIQGAASMAAVGQFALATTRAFGQTFSLGVSGNNLQLTTAAADAGPASAFWSGASDVNWSTSGNWNPATGAAPNYQSNVIFATTTPLPSNLSTNVLDVDFDINSLSFNAATGGVTVGGSKMLTLEATNANGNTAGSGITANNSSGINTISANVGLATTQTWTVASGGILAVSGVVGDFGGGYGLTKVGTGTLTLSGANTYSGVTTISAGVLNIQNASALGTGAAGTSVTSGAALQIQGSITTLAKALTLNGTGISLTGALRNISGINNYAGLITLGSATRINSDAGTLTISNTGTITGATFGLTVGGVGNTTIQSIIGTTTGSLTKDGTGTLTLSGANTYTGVTTVNSGTLKAGVASVAGANGAFGNNSAITLSNVAGTTLDITGFNTQVGALSGGGSTGGNVTLGAAILTIGGTTGAPFAGVISGAGGSLTKDGTGTLILSGNNTYTGTTTISAGTLRIGSGGTTGSLSANSAINNNGTLIFNRSNALAQGTDFAAVISGSGTMTQNGPGPLMLSGVNTYTGVTTVSGGALVLAFGAVTSNIIASASALTLGGGTLSLTGTGTQQLSGLTTTGSTGSKILLGSNQTLNLGTLTSAGGNSALNFNTAAGGANGNTVGSGIVLLSGQTAGTAINSGFTVSDSGGFGLATVNGSSQIVRLTTTTLLPVTGAASSFDYLINNNADGPAAAGSSSLTMTASQAAKGITVDTSAANGAVTLNSGVVLSNNIWNFGGTSSNTWQISGNASGAGLQAISNGSGIEINNYNGGTVTLNSPILANGSNTVNVKGTGTTVFAGVNTYTGATTIRGGTLQVTIGGSITHTTAAMTVGSGSGDNGTLNITGGAVSNTTGTLGSSAGSSGTATVSSGTWTNSGSLLVGSSGTGVLNVTDSGIVHVGGVVGTGTLTLGNLAGASGTLNLGTGGVAGTLNASSVTSGSGSAVVNFNHTGSYNFAPVLAGTLALNKLGAGTTMLPSTNTYSGVTIVGGGILEVNTNDALGTNDGGTSVSSGATLKLNGVNYTTAEALYLNGNGVANGGALANSGSSTFAGQITVATNSSIHAGGGILNLTGGLLKESTTLTFNGGGTVNVSGTGISGANNNSDLLIDGTTLVLSAASNFNGATIVQNNGVIVVNAAVTTTQLTINANNTLSGTGSIITGGATNYVNLSGALVVGDSTLSTPVGSSIDLKSSGAAGDTVLATSPGSFLYFDLFQAGGDLTATTAAADYLRLFGALNATAGGALIINDSIAGPHTFAAGDKWSLFDLSNGGCIINSLNFTLNFSSLGNLAPDLIGSFYTDEGKGIFSIHRAAPTVTAIFPSSGITLGGTHVTITGTDLTGATAVTIGGIAATNIVVVNSTTITAITPAGGAGTASILITTPDGTNVANTVFTYLIPAPDIAVVQASALTDGLSTIAFGNLPVSSNSTPLTFTISNPGTANLTGLVVTKDGAAPEDFSVSTMSASNIPVGADTAIFTVTFSPTSVGAKTASIHIASNVIGSMNPFDIALTGAGYEPSPEIVVQESAGIDLVSGSSSVDFGASGAGGSVSKSFTVRNTGTYQLTGLGITIDNAADFAVTAPPATPVLPGESTTFTVKFQPGALGTTSTVLHLTSNDDDETSFEIALVGRSHALSFNGTSLTQREDAVTIKVPVQLSSAFGAAFSVPFTVGGTATTADYTITTPSPVKFTATQTVAYISITIKDDLIEEGDESLILTLGTPSFASVTVVAPSVFTLTITEDDVMPVIAPLLVSRIVAVGDPVNFPSGATGSAPLALVWKKNGVVIAGEITGSYGFASAALAHGADYSITATNQRGNVSSTAQLAVVDRSDAIIRANAGSSPTMTVNATGSALIYRWRDAKGDLPVTGTKYAGVTTKTLTVKSVVTGDAGHYTCRVTGPGGSMLSGDRHLQVPSGKPITDTPAFQDVVAYNSFNYQLTFDPDAARAPTKYICSGLPAGLTCNSTTGLISGTPTKTGDFTVLVTLSNSAGAADTVQDTFSVFKYPAGAVGVYAGVMGRDTKANSSLGGRIDLTTTITGGYTGTLRLGATSYPLNGTLRTAPTAGAHPGVTLSIVRSKQLPVLLVLDLDPATNDLTGTVNEQGSTIHAMIVGWRNVWHTTATPTANPVVGQLGAHSFKIDPATTGPQGYGYGTVNVTNTGGTTVGGRTADGEVIATTGVLGPDGEVLVYSMLYISKGSILGTMGIDSDANHSINSTLDWQKTQATTARDYAPFGPLNMAVLGGKYSVTAPLLNLPSLSVIVTDNAQFTFSDAGLPSATNPNMKLRISNTNLLTLNPTNPGKINSLVLTPSTGAFSGKMTLTDPPALPRTVAFQGWLVPTLGKGYGYFLLPQLANPLATPPTTATTSLILSGKVLLEAVTR